MKFIRLTDINYGTNVVIRADHVSAVSAITLQANIDREGRIADSSISGSNVNTIGGNSLLVREKPDAVWALVQEALPNA